MMIFKYFYIFFFFVNICFVQVSLAKLLNKWKINGKLLNANTESCNSRKYNSDSFVCVCDKNYCDYLMVKKPEENRFIKYTSNRDGLRYHEVHGSFHSVTNITEETIAIYSDIKYQRIYGFGGTFSDSSGLNINTLSKDVQNKLLASYFSEEGNAYSLCRLPMGATDFSNEYYTYDDVSGDIDLKHFKLHSSDHLFKIPHILRALNLSNNKMRIIASPWTAPPWIKTNNMYNLIGRVKEEYYQVYANYYIKFLQSYKKHGINIWAVTTGNEPLNGFFPLPLPTTAWTATTAAKWVANNLGPTIRKSNFNLTHIIIHDDQKLYLPHIKEFYKNDEALKYVDGVGIHWYFNHFTPPYFVNYAFTPKKELYVISTEATTGFVQLEPVILGDWSRAESYIDDILQNFEYNVGGWIDFNIALDLNGGPCVTKFPDDSCIIVNASANEFYKQPLFYALGHFSKFIPPDSYRINSIYTTSSESSIETMAFQRPDNGTVLIIYNKGEEDKELTVIDGKIREFKVYIERRSISSILYW